MTTYVRHTDDKHVLKTEDALKHWDTRRAEDRKWQSLQPWNIGQTTYRVDAIFRAVNRMEVLGLKPKTASVLDVGCGQGDGLFPFLLCGFKTPNLHGIDLFADRVERGKTILPGLDLSEGDASAMPYPDASFDVVCEQFCFCHVPDEANIKSKIAAEMIRVTKPGGFIVIHDWRIGNSSRKLYAVSQRRIAEWFGLPIVGRFPSQLFPPIGRPLSTTPLYTLARLVPFFTGSWVTVLQH